MTNKYILARNLLLMAALDEIGAAAAGNGLDLVLLKGAALLSEEVYGPAEREMTDLDLLIRPEDENAFEELLTGLGFKAMENSSQAYYRMAAPSAPPVIADLHTALRHEKNTAALWSRAGRASTTAAVLGLEDQVLHLASHTLLHHGCLEELTLQDLGRLLSFVYAKADRTDFWRKTAAIAANAKLKPVIYPVFTRLSAAKPALLSPEELSPFEPRGTDKLKSRLFEKAAAKHTRLLEYLLPVVYRPSLFARYLFPGKVFLTKRYGKNSWTNHLKRPFQLLTSAFKKED